MAGFSEPFFLQTVVRVAKLGEDSGKEGEKSSKQGKFGRGRPARIIHSISLALTDGHTLAFIRQTSAGGDLYALSLEGDPQPHPVVKTSGYDGGGQFSPDGRWLAYVSNESGQFEVYLRPYPGPERKKQVSTQGGTHPRWNRNGKELFYRIGNKMMVVDVSTSSDVTLSQPRVLFEQRYAFGSLNIVLNWFEELKRLVPTK